jgi:hypothetical protein
MPLIPNPSVPNPRVINRTITRGMGAPRGTGRAGLITVGGGGFRQFIEIIRRKAGDGVDYVKKNVENIVVWARLITVNDEKPQQLIQGSANVVVTNKKITVRMTEGFRHRVRKIWENVKITINRIR